MEKLCYGNVEINQQGGKTLTLNTFRIKDGNVNVIVDGSVNVKDVIVTTESKLNGTWKDHVITIDTTGSQVVAGNIQVGYLTIGNYVENDDGTYSRFLILAGLYLSFINIYSVKRFKE